MAKRRAKGSVEDVHIAALFDPAKGKDEDAMKAINDLREAYEGCSIGLKHIGPGKARVWGFELEAWRQAELKRKRNMKRELEGDAEALQEVTSNDFVTIEGVRELVELHRRILGECVVRVKGFDAFDSVTDQALLADFVVDEGLDDKLIEHALEMQAVRPVHSFRASRVGLPPPERHDVQG